jgi:hypothetical protein
VVWCCLTSHGFVCLHFLCAEFFEESFVLVALWSYIVLVSDYLGRLSLPYLLQALFTKGSCGEQLGVPPPFSSGGAMPAGYFCRLSFLKAPMESRLLLLPPSLVERPACRILLEALFTKSSYGEQLLPPLPFSSVLRAPHTL